MFLAESEEDLGLRSPGPKPSLASKLKTVLRMFLPLTCSFHYKRPSPGDIRSLNPGNNS